MSAREMRVAAGWTDPRPLTVLSRARFPTVSPLDPSEGCHPRLLEGLRAPVRLPADAQQSTAREHAVGHEDLTTAADDDATRL